MSTTYAHLTDGQRALLLRSEVIALDILAPLARSGEPGRVNRLLIAELSTSGLVPRVLGARSIRARPLPHP
jgi:hypothetical protein